MNLILIFTLTALAASCEAKSCETSRDCGDLTGRSLCVANGCRKDIPCNKEYDCFFYGGQDIQYGLPIPKCVYPSAARKGKYGICATSTFSNELDEAPTFEDKFRYIISKK